MNLRESVSGGNGRLRAVGGRDVFFGSGRGNVAAPCRGNRLAHGARPTGGGYQLQVYKDPCARETGVDGLGGAQTHQGGRNSMSVYKCRNGAHAGQRVAPPRGVLHGPEVYKVPMNGKPASAAPPGRHTKHLGARRAWVSRGSISRPKPLGRFASSQHPA